VVKTVVTEEHITIVTEPGSNFLTHITPGCSTAKGIADSIIDYYKKSHLDLNELLGIGCDGTATNIGSKGGVIRLLELSFNKPLQWAPCLLHTNELPLRHLMRYLDGKTTGPECFSGPIGSALTNCDQLAICKFEPIAGKLPELTCSDLSTDQRYLYEICESVIHGICSEELGRRNPGKMAHSRWLTTANRILRLYVATVDPSPELKLLTTFVVKVYVQVWFAVKTKPSCKDGPKHLMQMIQLSRQFSDQVRHVIDPVIQRNAYFAHPENLLLAMIADERPHIRQLGLHRILKARTQMKKGIRFCVPSINFTATDYTELINWSKIMVTEPPLIPEIPLNEISSRVFEGNTELLQFIRVPCHTQAVERAVKLVTEASMSVCGETARNGFIKNRIQSRQQMAVFNKKSDYVCD